MGTTRPDAGSAENFVKIDHDIPLHVARLFKEANPSKPTHFCLLTSAGSSATSSFLYPRTEKPRMAEGVFATICKVLNPLTGGRAGSGISTVAKAMTKVAEKGIGADAGSQTTVDVYDNRQFIKLAEEQ
ncbi:hypothetical protein BDL97_13G039500 [Sphagnum fallax]|nr:hypothetical protein BDL97_13G039500 [Sphagnum fallax]